MNNVKDVLNKRKEYKKLFKEYRNKNKQINPKLEIPNGLYESCNVCHTSIKHTELVDNFYICPNCGAYTRIGVYERLKITIDDGTFNEKGIGYKTLNPLNDDSYESKINLFKDRTNLEEAYVYGYAEIDGNPTVVGVLDSYFMMGSMGSVVGEKVTKSFEYAIFKKLPIVIFIASGGARMQEGILSLMQMAKTSAAVSEHSNEGLLYISVLTHPTTGGVTASFAMLGDVIIAEPEALIGFAGPRVIKQTIKEDLPEGFQTSEFLLEKGFIDMVVSRKDMKEKLSNILKWHRR